MGRADEEALAAALPEADAGYVGLVASARRAASVRAALAARGVGEDALARLRSPAGLDLGHCTQPEIAVAILAQLITWRHEHPPGAAAHPGGAQPAEAPDPVCGMTVALAGAAATAEYAGRLYAFCSQHCHERFAADPEAFAMEVST
jgi:xanthine dehydrogenase accessory factor